MMAAASDNSNWGGGAAMRMGEAGRIASNLISGLLLVSDILFLFGIHYWQTCVMLVCVSSH